MGAGAALPGAERGGGRGAGGPGRWAGRGAEGRRDPGPRHLGRGGREGGPRGRGCGDLGVSWESSSRCPKPEAAGAGRWAVEEGGEGDVGAGSGAASGSWDRPPSAACSRDSLEGRPQLTSFVRRRPGPAPPTPRRPAGLQRAWRSSQKPPALRALSCRARCRRRLGGPRSCGSREAKAPPQSPEQTPPARASGPRLGGGGRFSAARGARGPPARSLAHPPGAPAHRVLVCSAPGTGHCRGRPVNDAALQPATFCVLFLTPALVAVPRNSRKSTRWLLLPSLCSQHLLLWL